MEIISTYRHTDTSRAASVWYTTSDVISLGLWDVRPMAQMGCMKSYLEDGGLSMKDTSGLQYVFQAVSQIDLTRSTGHGENRRAGAAKLPDRTAIRER